MAFDTGIKSDTGKRVFTYARPGTDVLFLDKKKIPVGLRALKELDGHPCLTDPIPIPCGFCSACLMDQACEISTRAVLEAQYWKKCYFITLTYSDRCLPIDRATGEAIVLKSELQRFFKRLRKYISFRYLSCGEYGDVTGRPHYHLILFTDDELKLDQFAINKYHAPILCKAWPFGMHEVSIADSGCISYVAGYVLKKCRQESEDDPHKPFRLMSRRPGLGFSYLLDHDVLQDGKVYGDFGEHCKSRKIPSAFIRKLEYDGFDVSSFKEANVMNGKRFQSVMHSVYDTSDPELLGGRRRARIKDRYEKARKEKI